MSIKVHKIRLVSISFISVGVYVRSCFVQSAMSSIHYPAMGFSFSQENQQSTALLCYVQMNFPMKCCFAAVAESSAQKILRKRRLLIRQKTISQYNAEK